MGWFWTMLFSPHSGTQGRPSNFSQTTVSRHASLLPLHQQHSWIRIGREKGCGHFPADHAAMVTVLSRMAGCCYCLLPLAGWLGLPCAPRCVGSSVSGKPVLKLICDQSHGRSRQVRGAPCPPPPSYWPHPQCVGRRSRWKKQAVSPNPPAPNGTHPTPAHHLFFAPSNQGLVEAAGG